MGEDREQVKPESTEDVEAHKLKVERHDLGKVMDDEREARPSDDDVEGHALIRDKSDVVKDAFKD